MEEQKTSLWADLREAVRGQHSHDYTEAPIGKAVLLLSVPMVLEVCMESVFAVVGIFFVSRRGPASIATVGLTEAMLTLLYSVALGLCMGAAAMVARRTGEKNPDGASIAAVQAMILAIAVSTPVAIAGGLLAPTLLGWMGASEEVIRVGTDFTRIMFAGNATIFFLFLINAIFRGAGDAAIAMRVLWFANAINIVLCPCFILGLGPFPELGVTGAAVATNIGRGCGVLYQITKLTRGSGRLQIRKEHLRLDIPVIRSMIKISGTGIFQSLVGTTSWLGLIRILSTFGSVVVAGYTIGIRIVVFALLPSWGMSNAAATLVGQNLGAGKPDRAEKSVWIACRYNFYFLGTVGLLFVLFAEPIVAVFTTDPGAMPYAVKCLRIVSLGFIAYAYGMVLTNAFNGAGDTATPTRINLFCYWLWEVPLGWVLARTLGFGPSGVFMAIAIAFSTLALISAWMFRKGKWKLKRL